MTARAAALLLLAAVAAAAAAAGAAAGVQALDLPLSGKECWEPQQPEGTPQDARSAWCRVSNLYLFQGGAYFLTENGSEVLPTVQYGKHPRVPQAVLPEKFRAMVPPGTEVLPLERAYLMRTGAQGCEGVRKGAYVNFGDGMTERITTLWMFLCEVMGHCSYADRAGLHLIDASKRSCRVQDPPSAWDTYPTWYRSILSCMSRHPLRHLNGVWRDRVVHITTAWVGLGQRCRSHYGHCHDPAERGKLPPTPALLGGWRRVLGQCLGFPTDAVAPLDPVRVMIVDRTYESHRHLLNVNTLLSTLRRRYSAHRVQLSLRYMEGLPVREQFHLWSRQTVVVHVHGSSIGHWQGLPHGAVVVKIAPLDDTYADTAYGDHLERDYRPVSNLTWLPLVNSNPKYLILATDERPLRDFRYKGFSDAEKLALLRADCEAIQVEEKQKICRRAIKFNMNLVVPPDVLADKVDAAIGAAYAKQGRQVPPDLLLPSENHGAEHAEAEAAADAVAGEGVDAGSAEGVAAGGTAAGGGGLAAEAAAQGQEQEQGQGQAGPWGDQRAPQEQQALQQQPLAGNAAPSRGRLHVPSVALGAAAAAGGMLLLRSCRRWQALVPGRRRPPASAAAPLF